MINDLYLLSIKQAAAYLGITEQQVRDFVKQKMLYAFVLYDGVLSFRRIWLDQFLERWYKREIV